MSDLTDFLLARIAEDEAVAKAATEGPWRWDSDYKQPGDEGTGLALTNASNAEVIGAYNYHCCSFRDDPTVEDNDAAHIARWDPVHVLAECQAKRRIVVRCQEMQVSAVPMAAHLATQTLDDLARAYADHEQFREEWRP